MFEEVREIVAEWLEVPLEEVTPETFFPYDSEELYILAELAVAVEDALDVKLDGYDKWMTVQDIVDSVEKAKGSGKKEKKGWFFGRKNK